MDYSLTVRAEIWIINFSIFYFTVSDANLFNKDIAAISESLSHSYNAFVNLQNEIIPEIKDTTLHYLVEEDNDVEIIFKNPTGDKDAGDGFEL